MVLHTSRAKYKTLSVLFIVYGDCDGTVIVPFNFCSQFLKVLKTAIFIATHLKNIILAVFHILFISLLHTFLSQRHHIPERILLTETPGPISPPHFLPKINPLPLPLYIYT